MNIATRFFKNILIAAFCLSAAYPVQAQTTREYAVMLQADISKAPFITISWEADVNAVTYEVFRRARPTDSWLRRAVITASSGENSFTDTTAFKGTPYEYQVLKTAYNDNGIYLASGYIYAGVETYPVVENRKVLLVIDESFKSTLATEITQFEADLKNEGWQVVKEYMPRTEEYDATEVNAVKQVITDEYNRDKTLLKTVILIGRVAVPYSGDIFPDGHTPDHRGAWPADGYYGDMNENLWTDNQVNNATATRPKNKNLVGDGKFDQPDFPSALELSVGRIDFFKMTKFLKTETDLLKAYFQRNHLFRTGALQIPQRGLIDDNFGPFSNGMQGGGRYVESFATTAWRSWTPLISYSKIVETDYVNTLDTASFLWSYGCGSGGYQSAGGIGTTEVFVQNSINTIFTSLFGSYFGDWDSDNNFLRAPLCATPGALTSVWAGRPHWFFHRMGLGEYIGHSALLSQNSSGQKDSRSYLSTWFINSENPEGLWYSNNAQGVHMALMGDPTLVMQPVSRNTAFKNLTTAIQGDRAIISWDITDESLISGYFIYRAKEKNGPFTRLNSEALKMPQYIDSTSPNIVNFYTVRAVKLQSSPSGSYYTSIADASSDSVFIYPTSVAGEDINLKNITIVPNPARDYADISFKSSAFEKTDITIMDVAGREVLKLYSGIPEAGGISISWSLIDANRIRVPAGIYFIRIASGKNITMNKVVVIGG